MVDVVEFLFENKEYTRCRTAWTGDFTPRERNSLQSTMFQPLVNAGTGSILLYQRYSLPRWYLMVLGIIAAAGPRNVG